MANNILKIRVAHKIDTKANWATSTLVLLKGETVYDENGNYKVGDGTKTWNELPYAGHATVVEKAIDPTEEDTDYMIGQLWRNTNSDDFFIFGNGWSRIPKANELDAKANASDVYTKTETNDLLNAKANATNVYTKTEADTLLNAKASLVDGKVPSAQLPSYVDDVIEGTMSEDFTTFTPTDGTVGEVGEAGKVYVDTNTNVTYRWSGTQYTAIGSSIALGETATTAFPGDRGKTLETKVAAAEATLTDLGTLANEDTVTTDLIADGAVTSAKVESLSLDKLVGAAEGTVVILDCGNSVV